MGRAGLMVRILVVYRLSHHPGRKLLRIRGSLRQFPLLRLNCSHRQKYSNAADLARVLVRQMARSAGRGHSKHSKSPLKSRYEPTVSGWDV